MAQTADRYPNQDLSLAMPGYMLDYMRLAERFGLFWVREALVELRTMARPSFFPDPGEARGVIEELMAKAKAAERAANPFDPCSKCMDGWIREEYTFKRADGTNVRQLRAVRCECWVRWRAALRTTQQAHGDGKVAAAGGAR